MHRHRRHRISVLELSELKKTLIWKVFNMSSSYQCLNVTPRMAQGCPSTSLVPSVPAKFEVRSFTLTLTHCGITVMDSSDYSECVDKLARCFTATAEHISLLSSNFVMAVPSFRNWNGNSLFTGLLISTDSTKLTLQPVQWHQQQVARQIGCRLFHSSYSSKMEFHCCLCQWHKNQNLQIK